MSNFFDTDSWDLRELVLQSSRFQSLNTDIKEAVTEEIRIILVQGYGDYFLELKEKNIKTKNRPNSWVAWCLEITDEKPTTGDLDRLIVSESGSQAIPDVDSDFSKNKRNLVKEYLVQKYGKDRVASVGTLGLLKTKLVLKDVARAFGHDYPFMDGLAKTIDEEWNHGSQNVVKETVAQIVQAVSTDDGAARYPKTAQLVRNYPEIFDSAIQMEGLPRQWGMHAGAVVITPRPLTECLPVRLQKSKVKGEEGFVTTQLDKNALEELGALKADILGLASLEVLDQAFEYIEKTQGKKIKLNDIPFDDSKTWDAISRGDTLGSFQICTGGIRNICRQYQPRNISDLGAIIAIYRPGPLENHMDKTFINRKRGHEPTTYLKPEHKTKPILEDTRGIIIYQEQVMLIAQVVAGYKPADADVLRKVISKSKAAAMKAEREKFVKGCNLHSNLSDQEANYIFDLIESFGRYGFNKSHSISYAVLAYQMMYVKVNYPLEFMTAWVNNKPLDKITSECIPEAKKLGIKIVAPDINRSFSRFAFDKDTGEVIFGLSSIKNCGPSAAATIIQERKLNGPFKDFTDFVERTNVNRSNIIALANAGAFRVLGHRADDIKIHIDDIKALIKKRNTIQERVEVHKEKVKILQKEFKNKIEEFEQVLNIDPTNTKIQKELKLILAKRDKAKQSAIAKNQSYLAELTQLCDELEHLLNHTKGTETLDEIVTNEFEAIECYITYHPLDDKSLIFMKTYLDKMIELEDVTPEIISRGEPVLFPCIFKDGRESLTKKNMKPMYTMVFEGRTGRAVSRCFGNKITDMKSKLVPGEIYVIYGRFNQYGLEIEKIKSLNNFFRTTFADYAERKGIDISDKLL